jgi:AraC-like DNA-binding protein
LAAQPKELIRNPKRSRTASPDGHDVLSNVLGTLRLSGSLQFRFAASGSWQTDAAPSLASMGGTGAQVMPFHILVAGECWLKMDGQQIALKAGDVVTFPYGSGHQLGVGNGGLLVTPTRDLPPKPWREIPLMRYGDQGDTVHLLCGFLQCDGVSFTPFRKALPPLMHMRTGGAEGNDWIRALIAQIAAEVERPRSGGYSMLERLTEIAFIELLRHQMVAMKPGSAGWLAALADPCLGRCLSMIHEDPCREWSVRDLSTASGLSRSTLAERFEAVLATSPMRYVRDWRLYLASVALSTTSRALAAIAFEAGYGTEAAFNRAFARAYRQPPAAWRDRARRDLEHGAGQ